LQNLAVFSALYQIKKLLFISCIELIPGKNAQYVRSAGTRGRLLRLDSVSHTALVQLPSKVKKIFSYYSFALYDQLALPEAKRYSNSKAGY
jgi:ribosomal protein L2